MKEKTTHHALKQKRAQAGNALIPLLVFMVVAIVITTTATALVITNSQNAAIVESGLQAELVAQSGIENALLQLIRNPSYTGETVTVGAGTATIVVSGGPVYQVQSIGRVGDFSRTIEVDAEYIDFELVVTDWRQSW